MNIFEYAKFKKMFGGGDAQANAPSVYAVSSIDELPSEAVTNSVAIVKHEYCSYHLNESIDIPSFYHIGMFAASGNYFNTFGGELNALLFGSIPVYKSNTGWLDDGYQNIQVYEPNETLAAWLNENGKIIGTYDGNMFYVYRNREWRAVGVQ